MSSQSKLNRQRIKWAWLFLAPSLTVLFIVAFLSLAMTLFFSFFNVPSDKANFGRYVSAITSKKAMEDSITFKQAHESLEQILLINKEIEAVKDYNWKQNLDILQAAFSTNDMTMVSQINEQDKLNYDNAVANLNKLQKHYLNLIDANLLINEMHEKVGFSIRSDTKISPDFEPVDNATRVYKALADQRISFYKDGNTLQNILSEDYTGYMSAKELLKTEELMLSRQQSLSDASYVALSNFKYILKDDAWWRAVRNTSVFTVFSVFFELLFGMIMALCMHQSFKGRGILRVAALVPWAIPTVVSARMWGVILDAQNGIVNHFFKNHFGPFFINISNFMYNYIGKYIPNVVFKFGWLFFIAFATIALVVQLKQRQKFITPSSFSELLSTDIKKLAIFTFVTCLIGHISIILSFFGLNFDSVFPGNFGYYMAIIEAIFLTLFLLAILYIIVLPYLYVKEEKQSLTNFIIRPALVVAFFILLWVAYRDFIPNPADSKMFTKGIAWTSDRFWSIFAVIAVDVWKTTPFMALLLLAALQIVPEDIYESARVDGINAWDRFWHLTFPIIRPAMIVALIFRTLDAVRVFDLPYVLTPGSDQTMPITYYAQNLLIADTRFGVGSAASVLIFIIVAIIATAYLIIGKVNLSKGGTL